MANTYVKIASATVGSGGTSSVSFTSIPQTYTDLQMLVSFRTNAPSESWGGADVRFNGVGSGYSGRYIRLAGGTGADSGSYSAASTLNVLYGNGNSSVANSFGSGQIYIPNYANNQNKSISMEQVNEDNQTVVYSNIWAALWSNTAAITSIEFTPSLGGASLFRQHSTFTLYGIKNS